MDTNDRLYTREPDGEITRWYVFGWDDGDDILGFVGAFKWEDNQLTSLDGDTYNPDMPVIGYEEFEDGVDILVKGGEW